VKRVIGVAGDTIVCCDDQGRISVNGEPLDEDAYIRGRGIPCNGPMVANCSWEAGPVPEGHVFVMGDNRSRSADSTVHLCRPNETDCVSGDEFVPVDLVVGKVFVLLWPAGRFDFVGRPESFAGVPDRS
jgi:signal peptidase I